MQFSSSSVFFFFLRNKTSNTLHAKDLECNKITNLRESEAGYVELPQETNKNINVDRFCFRIRKKKERILETNLADSINEITKKETRSANEKLLPSWLIRQRDSKQRSCLFLLHFFFSLKQRKDQKKPIK